MKDLSSGAAELTSSGPPLCLLLVYGLKNILHYRELKVSARRQPRRVGWDGMGGVEGGRIKREGTCVYLWLIHVDVWQKPT